LELTGKSLFISSRGALVVRVQQPYPVEIRSMPSPGDLTTARWNIYTATPARATHYVGTVIADVAVNLVVSALYLF
jgi:hypothetical protein